MSDLTDRLRALAEEWWECCGDIHVPLAEAADALEAAEAELARLEHQLQQAEEATAAAYKDAETAEARSADLQARSADLQAKLADLSNKVAAIRTHCQDNLAARSMGDYENGYDAACLDILDILEAQ